MRKKRETDASLQLSSVVEAGGGTRRGRERGRVVYLFWLPPLESAQGEDRRKGSQMSGFLTSK